MPRLAIIDHVVSSGGVERFLHGLVGGLLETPRAAAWEILVLLGEHGSDGRVVTWPVDVAASNLRVDFLKPAGSGRLSGLRLKGRVLGIPGSGRLLRAVPDVVSRSGMRWAKEFAGDPRVLVERTCRQGDFDVAYFSYPYLMRVPALEQPIVCTPHDFNFKHFDTLEPRTRRRIEREMPGWMAMSRGIVVSSETVAKEACEYYPSSRGKVHVVPLGIPGSGPAPTPAELDSCRLRHRLPPRFLLVVGWLVSHKNQRVVLEALGSLRDVIPDLGLVCVGPNTDMLQPDFSARRTSYAQSLVCAVERVGLRNGRDVLGLGFVSDRDLAALYRLATALIVPSLYEAGSFPGREAMQVGCPVAFARIPSLEEEFGRIEGNAWLFDPQDADDLARCVISLVGSSAAAQKADKAQQLVARLFSWRQAAEGYLDVFEAALG
ncbi:MAG: glycosyltransferase family 4 protein [Thermoleophilia bacterium]|nr:glycosyltransferase family 4 protein [Thermoleophilia bacterium]